MSEPAGVPISWFEDHLGKNATYDPDGRLCRGDLEPGAAQWLGHEKGQMWTLLYACPCGCRVMGSLQVFIEGGAKPLNPTGQYWWWDGNMEKPTLNPSIQKTSPCRWHGYLQQGLWVRK